MAFTCVFFSCSQQEGIGGNSHIKGKIMVNYYNDDFSQLLYDQPIPAKDEDVFLIFGNDSVIGEDTKTSFTGNFEFEYLWPGKYKLYYFSEDTTGKSSEPIEIVKEFTLEKNETLDLNDLIISKKLKWDEGNSFIKGKIMINYYNTDFSLLLSDEPVPAKDEDVFLVFGNDQVVGKDTKTSFTGDFTFEYLWPGKYKLYYYSYDSTGQSPEKVEVIKEITLGENETLELSNLIIKKKIKWDEGTSFINGKVMINYYNDENSLLSSEPVPAKDEDVFLIYGNSTVVNDDTKSSYTGDFGFKNLWPGNYTIYSLSDDVSNNSSEPVVIKKEIALGMNETVKMDDLIINKVLKWDEGTSSIKGTVYVKNYKNSSTYPDLEIKDITPAQDQDIYIQYGNHPFYDKRIATSSDGTFLFPKLIKGKYKIFLYSEDVSGGTASKVIVNNVEITEDQQNIVLEKIIYIDKL
jgi:hypothetical protein